MPESAFLAPQLDTSHVCVIDRDGNVFAATPSDGSYNAPVVPGLGIIPSPRGSQNWGDPDHPSGVAPGKRPRLTPSPAIAMQPGKMKMPFGTPGGDVQTQAMLQVFLNIHLFGMEVQEAVEAPRVASYSFPSSFEPHAYHPGPAQSGEPDRAVDRRGARPPRPQDRLVARLDLARRRGLHDRRRPGDRRAQGRRRPAPAVLCGRLVRARGRGSVRATPLVRVRCGRWDEATLHHRDPRPPPRRSAARPSCPPRHRGGWGAASSPLAPIPILGCGSSTELALPAQAQNYPTRPIRMISPFAAGGANDVLARLLGVRLADRLRGSVVVENRPGAGAVIGLTALARSVPDGYTLALSGSTLAVTGALYKKPPFDAMKDFAPIALVTHYPFVLVVNASLPVHSVAELIRLAKEQPGQLLYASPGVASSQHLYTELFKSMAGIEVGHIPYTGTAPAVVDIVAGRVSLMFAAAAPSLPLIREGKLRALGVTSTARLAEAPESRRSRTPFRASMRSTGRSCWRPPIRPKDIVNRLHDELKAIMAMTDVQEQIGKIGMMPYSSPPPAELPPFISSEVARWGKIVQQAGIAGTL